MNLQNKMNTLIVKTPLNNEYVPCGTFEYMREQQIGRFFYFEEYIAMTDAYPIDPINLPLSRQSFETEDNNGVFSVFADTIAGAFWKKILVALYGDVDDFALLCLNKTAHDFFLFSHKNDIPQENTQVLPSHNLSLFDDLLIKMENEETLLQKDKEHVQAIFNLSFSLGGMRPKVFTIENNRLWVAKFPEESDKYNNPLVEYATMTLAAKCGMNVPNMLVKKVNNKGVFFDVFLIEAFAKSVDKKQALLTGLTLMSTDERDYQNFSYLTMMENYKKAFCVTEKDKKECGRELFKRIAFNIFVRNIDDHPKNHSFLYDGKTLTLSPLYDVVPTLSTKGINSVCRLACSFGEDKKDGTLKNLLSRLDVFALTKEEALDILAKMTEQIKVWKEHFQDCGVSQKDIELLANTFESSFLEENLVFTRK